ncbi:MAG: mechanosensitive ion channel family protein [Candidatus Cloacimonetes bacterium]|nr:mechanosensitive ion channel family protein [Candidatus Cloacimonadota bacterium]
MILLTACAAGLFAKTESMFEIADKDSTLSRAPIVYDDTVLFNVYAGLDDFSAYERSVVITKRLEELTLGPSLVQDSLHIESVGNRQHILYADKLIIIISEADSLALKTDMDEITQAYYTLISERFIPLFIKYSFKENIFSIIKTILLAALVIGLAITLFRLLARLMNMLKKLVARLKKDYKLGIVIRGFRLLNAEQFDRFLNFLINLINLIFIIIIGYFALYFLLYVIPYTRFIALQLQAYIMRPIAEMGSSILHYLPNLFFIAVVIFASHYILKFLRYFFNEIKKGNIRFKSFYADWADSTYQIVKFFILFFVVVIIFPYLPGSGSPAFQGISIFVGVLVSLGSSSAVSNIIAGIILTYMRAFRIGDFIKIGDKEGFLIETSMLTIKIKTVKNVEISIPNSVVLSGNIIDFSSYAREGNLILHTTICMGYEVPFQKVEEILKAAALESEGINIKKEPFVHVKELKDYYVEYELNAYTDKPESMGGLYSELHKNIMLGFEMEGISLLLPTQSAVKIKPDKA